MTLVNARAQFVERVRLHQVAAGQQVGEYPLRERLRGTGRGLPTGQCAAAAITARLAGREPRPLRFRYVIQCISLDRRDGLIQFVHSDDSPHKSVLTGRAAARCKELVVRGALRATR